MREQWKDVEGWEGIYQISNHGRLKSFKRLATGYVLSNVNKKGGYLSIVLRRCRGCPQYTRMHRLVAEAFIPNPKHRNAINHKDGNKQNNCVANLEWVTTSENARDAIARNPNMVAGMRYYNQCVRPKKVQQFTLDGVFIAEYHNCFAASRHTGVCSRNIFSVASGEEYKPGMTRSQAGGYIWKHVARSQCDS